jgi:hypothetical protein
MASKHLEVASYLLYFRPKPSTTWGFPGGFIAHQCYGYLWLRSKTSADGFYIAIIDNSETTLPDPKTSVSGTYWSGATAIKQENLTGMIDLLRNEKPIYMTLWDNMPIANTISTSNEPIGEGADTSP